MSEAPQTSDIAYQPVSGWAIAGLGISGLFTLMVVGSAIVGLFQGAPVFFPIWMLSVAGVGALLSYIGQRHIETSENTRTGLKLARIGIWLGIISGVSYLSYFYVTGLALEAQANSFLLEETDNDTGFFRKVQKGELNAAFLLTRPAQARAARPNDEKGMNEHYNTPTKEGPGDLTQFRDGQLARILFKELGSEKEGCKIEPGQVIEWSYAKRSYVVRRMYRIKTKEVEVDYYVTVQSSEGEAEGQGRKWFVNMRETFVRTDTPLLYTPVGVGVKTLRDHARSWINAWVASLNNGEALADVVEKDKTNWDLVPIQGAGADTVKVRDGVRRAFQRTDKNRLTQYMLLYREGRPDLDVGKWESINGRIRVYYSFYVTIPETPSLPPLKVEVNVGVETREPVDPARFNDRSPPPGWSVASITFPQVTVQTGRPHP